MTSIPGLNFCPVGENDSIEIASFEGNILIPGSYWHGLCHTVKDYEKVNVHSKDSFGTIYKCKKKGTEDFYSLKKPNLPKDSIPSDFLREINILIKLQHFNIVKYYETVAGKDLYSNFLVLEYCPVMLKDLIQKEIKEVCEYDVIKYIMEQLFNGLAYIHEAMIVHRNIQDENILFTEQGILKISGFNASRYAKQDMTPHVFDLTHCAPELLFKTKQYSYAVDMWSAGCIFAKLLLRKDLFPGKCELEVLRSIFNVLGTPSEGIWPGFADLLLQCVEAERFVQEAIPYSSLKDIFHDQPLSCIDLIKELLYYYPKIRFSAKDCIKSTYITELPNACSAEKMSSILKLVQQPEESMKVEQKIDTNFLFF